MSNGTCYTSAFYTTNKMTQFIPNTTGEILVSISVSKIENKTPCQALARDIPIIILGPQDDSIINFKKTSRNQRTKERFLQSRELMMRKH